MNDWRGGDERDRRFDAIYRRQFRRVYRFYRSKGVSDDEAQDLAQECFKRMYEKFQQYRGDAEGAYVLTIARNVLLNWLRGRNAGRRAGNVVELDDPELGIDVAAPDEPDYAERQQSEIRSKRLERAMSELSQGQQEVLRLAMVGFQYNEIAAILKISIDAVKSRLRDAKRHLRAKLGEEA